MPLKWRECPFDLTGPLHLWLHHPSSQTHIGTLTDKYCKLARHWLISLSSARLFLDGKTTSCLCLLETLIKMISLRIVPVWFLQWDFIIHLNLFLWSQKNISGFWWLSIIFFSFCGVKLGHPWQCSVTVLTLCSRVQVRQVPEPLYYLSGPWISILSTGTFL